MASAHLEKMELTSNMDSLCFYPHDGQDNDYGFFDILDDDEPFTSSPIGIPSGSDRYIKDQLPGSLEDFPPILNPIMVEQIVEEGLPWSMQDMQWNRLFASSRDGGSFGAFMRNVRGHQSTIIVARTNDGHIVGGFATEQWSGRKSNNGCNLSNHAFLFSVSSSSAEDNSNSPVGQSSYIPGIDMFGSSPTSTLGFEHASRILFGENDKNHVAIHKQHNNRMFKQVCQVGNKYIAMGDGGDVDSFGLSIGSSFSKGSTSISVTNKENLTIIEFEVYGFSEA